MPRIVGGAVRVVETDEITIDELTGNVATKEDRISIAHVKVSAPAGEPWLTLHYDEWMAVLKGRMVLHYGNDETLEVKAGETVFIAKGERFRPEFPEGGTEYVPVCLPAFRPDRCIREDDPEGEVSTKLRKLHDGSAAVAPEGLGAEVLYHMCQVSLWEAAKAAGEAYFPPTFEKDGFMHATAVPSRLIQTANHFYQDIQGDWVCLRFKRSALRKLGIITKDEVAKPVGDKPVVDDHGALIFPHVFGGLPPQAVDAEFPMVREGTKYTVIQGLTDAPRRIFKLATAEEAAAFKAGGKVNSSLDQQDGFVHLSDRTSPPLVAKLFFKGCKDLQLLELDAEKLAGPVKWIVGHMGDAPPSEAARQGATTTIHYLRADGCVHVYGDAGVSMDAVVRQEAVPLGEDGVHVFPLFL